MHFPVVQEWSYPGIPRQHQKKKKKVEGVKYLVWFLTIFSHHELLYPWGFVIGFQHNTGPQWLSLYKQQKKTSKTYFVFYSHMLMSPRVWNDKGKTEWRQNFYSLLNYPFQQLLESNCKSQFALCHLQLALS